MKSTKIEDILETVDEDITDDVTDAAAVRNDDVVNNELKMQLDNLQNELSNMKQSEPVAPVHVPMPVPVMSAVPSMSMIDKLMTFKNDDFKNALVMMLLFIVLNSTQVNEMIDMYMPYSIYAYGYIVKAILYFVLYRVIVTLIIA